MASFPTANFFYDTYHPSSGRKCAVSIRIYFARKYKCYPSPYKLTKAEYAKVFGKKPRGTNLEIQEDLIDRRKRANEIIKAMGERFSFALFEKQFLVEKSETRDLFILFKEKAKQLRREERISTAVAYENAETSIKKFYGKETLNIECVDVPFLYEYERWMLEQGNTSTTIGFYLRNVRAVYNTAVKEKMVAKELYPFGRTKDKLYTIPTGKNIKKALSLAEIQALFEYKPVAEWEGKALDFWKLIYLSCGMNIKDVALLRYSNIKGKKIEFERAKTERANKDKPIIISFPITSEIRSIMNKWGNPATPGAFIFPIYKPKSDASERYKLNQLFVAFVNNNMRKIAAKLGISENPTSYVARHSHATVLLRSGKASLIDIRDSLGHSDIRTTQSYLASIQDENDKLELASQLTNFSSLTKENVA